MRTWLSGSVGLVLLLCSCASGGPASADPVQSPPPPPAVYAPQQQQQQQQQQPPSVNPVTAEERADAPAAAGGALTAESSVDQILDALDVRGQSLEGFVADVRLKEEDDIGLSNTRTGKVWFQKLGGEGDARIRVSFDKREDEKNIYPDKIDYVLDKGWLIDRDHRKKVEVRRQVLKPGEKINLLKLGEGPFPLPIGQKKEEVHKLFDVEKVSVASKDEPAGTVHLRLSPKKGTEFARKFNSVDAWVDVKTHFPRRIDTVDASENNFKSTELTNVTVNPKPGLSDREFTLEKVDADQWDVINEPFSE